MWEESARATELCARAAIRAVLYLCEGAAEAPHSNPLPSVRTGSGAVAVGRQEALLRRPDGLQEVPRTRRAQACVCSLSVDGQSVTIASLHNHTAANELGPPHADHGCRGGRAPHPNESENLGDQVAGGSAAGKPYEPVPLEREPPDVVVSLGAQDQHLIAAGNLEKDRGFP